MRIGDVVAYQGRRWRVDQITPSGLWLSAYVAFGIRAERREIDPGDVTVVEDRDDTRICMGSNSRPACYLPLSECKCGEAS